MSNARLSRRLFGSSLLALALSGCGGRVIKRVMRSAEIAAGYTGLAYDPAEARQLPYATMDARVGVSPNSLVVLYKVENGRLSWLTADEIVLQTQQGRLMGTSGFIHDLIQTIPWSPDPILNRTPISGPSIRQVDLSYRSLYGLTLDSQWHSHGLEEIDIYGDKKVTEKVSEYTTCRQYDWEFENTFWRDDTGFVWKAVQHFLPETPPLETMVLKKYKG